MRYLKSLWRISKENNVDLKEKIKIKLKEVIDPELRENVWDLKLVKDLKVNEVKRSVSLKFRPTAYQCPLGIQLAMNIKKKLMKIEELDKIDMKVIDYVMADKANKYLKEMD
ncbi:MAG: DUF59 domain-containing protein [Candidatus Mcinerneyibacterium aminivorans]|jgi:metal-sulfur cluster biosynthetic enzyme|uniref:DUF59 domain-containing protein n=1 Tax=Candidatus Mcinerneyibacterium aminivorans TaxID=2703815 RepID=A0A5D0MDC7_9BACT|nr:MAG: DUF59 domain-containing protein [Candidatus Mcinerneyibacterium aminivorans]